MPEPFRLGQRMQLSLNTNNATATKNGSLAETFPLGKTFKDRGDIIPGCLLQHALSRKTQMMMTEKRSMKPNVQISLIGMI